MGEWKEYKLKDIAEVQIGLFKDTFFDMRCLSDSSMAISEGIKRTVTSGLSIRKVAEKFAKATI